MVDMVKWVLAVVIALLVWGAALSQVHVRGGHVRKVNLATGTGAGPTLDTVNYTITANSDDCFIEDDATMYLDYGSIYMGNDGSASQDLGLRFQSVAIPNGSTITSAIVTFTAYGNNSGTTCNITIKGEDVDDAATFSTIANFTGRVRTATSVTWSGLGSWSDNSTYPSADVATIVQDVVGRLGWSSGNDFVLFFEDNSSTGGAVRIAGCKDGGESEEATFEIIYEL